MARGLCLIVVLALSVIAAHAADHSPLQDFCVADMNGQVRVNGFACKTPSSVQANDFYFGGMHIMGNTSNALGSSVTPAFVFQVPGLNTLGISLARLDFAPRGVIPPHTHPRATEILTVLEGQLEVGFVTSNPENRHISKILNKGDVFVFPVNLVHYQRNVGSSYAVAMVALSSQNPGVIAVASAVFGSNPDISTDILSKAFQVSDDVITDLQLKF
uniref:putative germin-like protein 2-1 n=1 Tax=Erigeron canadensis TaxID=72917 RepID=UPI001CB9979B|nr:putative germin-like protein 2-1 [Erigeron canadensis]